MENPDFVYGNSIRFFPDSSDNTTYYGIRLGGSQPYSFVLDNCKSGSNTTREIVNGSNGYVLPGLVGEQLLTRTVEATATIAAGDSIYVTDFSVAYSGYTPVCVVGINHTATGLVTTRAIINGTNLIYGVTNLGNSVASNASLRFVILYTRN